ncbi:head-tail connector protein [Actimicrobium sp. CCC2.4]|jgi:hypothetical protein|uniref:head-tail connector protein n=1 Tax=Actimicrobium sp. CCC2.4 TaxID=3048606 RepID=UPI002AC90969|nr:head-tail connector protein [Actimicrobium sp. CCC2.4]MEB0133785.1 head-tail connector protein [Actimicrobium sp. CCC2.4]WPX31328.1 head-tail connector protein [Actimicrobium sp. CCC2.4]
MTITTLDAAKIHLRVDGSDEDSIIAVYLGAAELTASNFMERAIYADATAQGTDTTGIVINDGITAAILLITGHLYAHREDVTTVMRVADMPSGSRMLMQQYRLGMAI